MGGNMKVYLYKMNKYKLEFNKVVEYNLLRKSVFGFFMLYCDFAPVGCCSLTATNEFSICSTPMFFKKLKKSEEQKFYKKYCKKYGMAIQWM